MKSCLISLVTILLSSCSTLSLAEPPPVSPEHQAIVEALKDKFPPGTKFRIDTGSTDHGDREVLETGKGRGPSQENEGDNLQMSTDGSAPEVGLGGGRNAKGGNVKNTTSLEAFRMPPVPWENPLFWFGLALLGGAGAGFYFKLPKRLVIGAAIAGAAFIASAFWPIIWIFGMAAGLLAIFWPWIKAEIAAHRNGQAAANDAAEATRFREALRAVVAGIDDPSLPAETKNLVKSKIDAHVDGDGQDRDTIREIKIADGVGKFA